MLVLCRKVSEVIRIGDHIRITIVRIGPATVRLGIDAPKELNIVREEIAGNLAAALEASGLTIETGDAA